MVSEYFNYDYETPYCFSVILYIKFAIYIIIHWLIACITK